MVRTGRSFHEIFPMQCKSVLWRLLLLATVAAPQLATAANVADFSNFSLTSGSSVLLPGRLYIPPEATADPTIPRPLILFLHGGGESGSNNLSQINGNIDNLLAEAKRRGAYLYAPQTSSNWSSSTVTGRVKTMIDRALVEQNVDDYRLYTTGLSNGGGGTWNMLNRYPNLFAAAVPICGVSPGSDFNASNLADQAIVAFHARNDSVVSVVTSRNVLNSILTAAHESLPTYPALGSSTDFVFNSAVRDLSYVEWAAGGHGIWGPVYSMPQLYDWMFSHTTVPEPTAAVSMTTALIILILPRRRQQRRNSLAALVRSHE